MDLNNKIAVNFVRDEVVLNLRARIRVISSAVRTMELYLFLGRTPKEKACPSVILTHEQVSHRFQRCKVLIVINLHRCLLKMGQTRALSHFQTVSELERDVKCFWNMREMCAKHLSQLKMHYCKCALYVSSAVILLDSKAQQTELEWISSPPSGVSWKLYNFFFTHKHLGFSPL